MTTTTAPRVEVSLSVIAVLRPEGYEEIPEDIRSALGGLTHAEHAAQVDEALAGDVAARREPAVVLFRASEVIEASREARHFHDEHARALLDRIVTEEVLGGGVQIGYETVSSLLEDTFAQGSTLEVEVDPAARAAFADLVATYGEEGVEDLHRAGSDLLGEVLDAATSAALLSVDLRWADHLLEVQASINTESGSPVLNAPSEFYVATALLGVQGVTGRVELLQVASLSSTHARSWAVEHGSLRASSPLPA